MISAASWTISATSCTRRPWGTAFLGYAYDELGPPLSRVAPGDREHADAWFDEVRALPSGTESRSVALRFVAHDGEVHTCEVTAENRSDEASIGGIVLNVHDVSAVVTAEARLAAVADAVADIIVICDEDARIMWASGAVRAMLGIEPDDLVGVSPFDFIHADDHAAVAARFAGFVSAADTDEIAPIDFRLRHADGTYLWFEGSGNNELDDPSIRGLVISLRDITDRRSAETALRLSEELNRSIVEAAADAIISVDFAGVIRSFNPAAEDIFGTAAADAIGSNYRRFLSEESLLALRDALAIGRAGEQIETFAIRSSGQQFAAHVAVSQVRVGDTQYYTAVVRDVSNERALEQALRIAATFDELTGLPNRRTLLDRAQGAIEDARRTNDVVGMVFVDLDRFKLVNDGLGHDAGDQLLVLVADRIAAAIRVEDVVARLGSDEFVVLCPSASDLDAIKAVASRIVDALARAFVIADNEVFVGASLGVSVSTGSETPIELLRYADTAMYRAKEHGNTRVEVFDARMQQHAARRLELESALRQATARGELLAYYQPIIDLRSWRVSGLEALIRWDRPGVGLVAPDDFIPVAEDAGIINEIGPWMLRRATNDCAAWQDIAPGVGVSVNVSVRQFESGDLVRNVRDSLAGSRLPADLLTIEITESVMLDDSEHNAVIMRQIRDLGVHISLDDFGSGYSSLTYLRLLPIDSIKIDRSFLQSLGSGRRDDAMLGAIVNLGTAHDLVVVAEGIDTEAKLTAVVAMGCHQGQGYLFAKPMPLATTLEYLADEHRLSPRRHRRRLSRRDPVARAGDEHRDPALRALLVLRVRRVRRHRAFPPLGPLGPVDLADVGRERFGTVLDHHRVGVRFEVEVPHGVLGRAAHRRDERVLAVVLHAHQRRLADQPRLGAARGHDDDGQPGVAQRVGLAPAGAFVGLDLLADPLPRARLVLAFGRHGPESYGGVETPFTGASRGVARRPPPPAAAARPTSDLVAVRGSPEESDSVGQTGTVRSSPASRSFSRSAWPSPRVEAPPQCRPPARRTRPPRRPRPPVDHNHGDDACRPYRPRIAVRAPAGERPSDRVGRQWRVLDPGFRHGEIALAKTIPACHDFARTVTRRTADEATFEQIRGLDRLERPPERGQQRGRGLAVGRRRKSRLRRVREPE